MTISDKDNVTDLDQGWESGPEEAQQHDSGHMSERLSAASLLRRYDAELHHLAKIFPPMTDEEIAGLLASLETEGQHDEIIMYEGMVLDGSHRYACCRFLGIEPKTKSLPDGVDPLAFVIARNSHRRHLSPVQRAAVAADLKVHLAEQARLRQQEAGGSHASKALPDRSSGSEQMERHARESTAIAAKSTGAGIGATQKLAKVRTKSPNVFEAARAGKIGTVSEAEKLSALPSEEQALVLAALETEPPAKRRSTKSKLTPLSADDGAASDNTSSLPEETLVGPDETVLGSADCGSTPSPEVPPEEATAESEPEPALSAPSDDPVAQLVILYCNLDAPDQMRFLLQIDAAPRTQESASVTLSETEPQSIPSPTGDGTETASPKAEILDCDVVRAALLSAIAEGRTTATAARKFLDVSELSLDRFLNRGQFYGKDRLAQIVLLLRP